MEHQCSLNLRLFKRSICNIFLTKQLWMLNKTTNIRSSHNKFSTLELIAFIDGNKINQQLINTNITNVNRVYHTKTQKHTHTYKHKDAHSYTCTWIKTWDYVYYQLYRGMWHPVNQKNFFLYFLSKFLDSLSLILVKTQK